MITASACLDYTNYPEKYFTTPFPRSKLVTGEKIFLQLGDTWIKNFS